MKRLLFFLIMSFFLDVPGIAEESIFKPKQPKQNTSQLKMELGRGLQNLLHQCTMSIRTITELVDEIVVSAQQLSGEQDGPFATNDKQELQVHIKKINEMQKLLLSVEKELHL